jgi:hypothetical protein
MASGPGQPRAGNGHRAPFDTLNEDHLNTFLDLAPEVGTALGLPERDDRWPDPSEEARGQTLACLRRWARDLAGLTEEELTLTQRLDRRVFLSHLELVEWACGEAGTRAHDPDLLEPVAWTLFRQLLATGVPEEERFRGLCRRLERLETYLEEARRQVTVPDATWLGVAGETLAGFEPLLMAIRGRAAESGIPLSLQEDLEKAAAQAGLAAAAQAAWLKGLSPSDKPLWVLGPSRVEELCRLRLLPYSTRDLREMAAVYVTEFRAERRRFGRRLSPGTPEAGVLGLLRQDHAASFQEVLQRVAEVVGSARAFIQGQDLCPLPELERLVVMETPAALVPLVPVAALACSPKFAPEQVGVFLVTAPPPDGSLEVYHQAMLENMAIHEGYPGHHLQLAVANLGTGVLRDGVPLGFFAPDHAAWAHDLVEGWAHYCETLMREAGFRDGDAARVEVAHDGVWRAVRVTVDLGLATGDMSPETAEQVLVTEAGLSPAAARAEVRRCTRDPGQALSYLAGRHRIFSLRREASVAWRGDYSHRRFHELLLSCGNVPLRFVAERLAAPRP